MTKDPLKQYATIPAGEIVGEVREAMRTQLHDHRKIAEALAAAGVDVEMLIRSVANNAAQRLLGISLEEQEEQ